MGKDYIYGKHSVKEALLNGHGKVLFIQKDLKNNKLDEIIKVANKKKVTIEYVNKKDLEKLVNKVNHQGVALEIEEYKYLTLAQLLAKTTKDDAKFLILDHLEDPHNLGAILRTADATGIDGVIIPKDRAVGITPVVIKTATGAVEYVPIAQVTNLSRAVDKLKKAGFWIFGTAMTGTSLEKWNTSGKLAVIIGNEGKGIAHNLAKKVDSLITIPMVGHVQSLNASVAAGILMYQILVNRRQIDD